MFVPPCQLVSVRLQPDREPIGAADPDTGVIVTNTFDVANRLLTSTLDSDSTTYTDDANGNQLTIEEPGGDITTNTWDGENRLVVVEHPSGDVVTYAYNGDGLRVSLDDGVEVVRYVYDGNNLLQETDDTGVVTAEYTYQPGEYGLTISQHRDGDSSFHHFDGIHNTAGLTDGTGTVTDEYQFDAFGESRSSTGATPNPHTYKGEYNSYYKDPLAGPGDSIYSLHHRQYEATTGRFKSQDPIADGLERPSHGGLLMSKRGLPEIHDSGSTTRAVSTGQFYAASVLGACIRFMICK